MALNEHFKALRVDAEIAKEEEEPRERLDLALKEGQTIKVCFFINFLALKHRTLITLFILNEKTVINSPKKSEGILSIFKHH